MTSDARVFQGPNQPELLSWNMAQLLDAQASRHGQRVAIASLHEGTSWTYRELRDKAAALAVRLLVYGVGPGDRVMLLAGNGLDLVRVFMAVAAAGAVAVIINPTLSVSDVRTVIDAVGMSSSHRDLLGPCAQLTRETVAPRCFFIAPKIGFRTYAELLQDRPGIPSTVLRVILGDSSEGAPASTPGSVALNAFVGLESAAPEAAAALERWGRAPPSEACCFQLTSGTTGARKASMLSHRNLINNAHLVGHRLWLSSADVVCCSPPLSHCFGLVCGLLASCVYGATMVLPSEIFNPAATLQALDDWGCTVVHGVPSMFEALLAQEAKRRVAGAAGQLKLRRGIIAGSPPARALLDGLKTRLGLERLIYPFGMTELSAVCMATSLDESLVDGDMSVGTAMSHTSVKVVNEAMETLPANVAGELCVSGYLMHLGYFGDGEKTEAALHRDGAGRAWLRTGDIVSMDERRRCRVVGRSKNMIKKYGENIAPGEIETALLACAEVACAAVVGIPRARSGEAIVAFVEMAGRGSVDAGAIRAELRRQRLAPHMMPDRFVAIGGGDGALAQLPFNASGKVPKRELHEWALAAMR